MMRLIVWDNCEVTALADDGSPVRSFQGEFPRVRERLRQVEEAQWQYGRALSHETFDVDRQTFFDCGHAFVAARETLRDLTGGRRTHFRRA